jgi:hypothetical protein
LGVDLREDAIARLEKNSEKHRSSHEGTEGNRESRLVIGPFRRSLRLI